MPDAAAVPAAAGAAAPELVLPAPAPPTVAVAGTSARFPVRRIVCVGHVIAIASRSMELRPGDLIMTGTPEGVGKIERGQTVTGGIEGLGDIRIAVR